MTKIYVVRHGMTKHNRDGIIMGSLDSELLPESIEETKVLAKKLSGKGIEIIFSSDIGRVRKTAEIMNETLKKKIIFTKELRELDYGALQGMKKSEAKKRFPAFHKDVNFRNPGGECFQKLFHRIKLFLKKIEGRHQKILLITHAGCIRAIYSFLSQEEFQDNINMRIPHHAVLRCEICKEGKPKTRFIEY